MSEQAFETAVAETVQRMRLFEEDGYTVLREPRRGWITLSHPEGEPKLMTARVSAFCSRNFHPQERLVMSTAFERYKEQSNA